MSSSSRVPQSVRRRAVLQRTARRRVGVSLSFVVAGGLFWGCHTAEVARLNPGVEPARYRVVCRESFQHCRSQVKEQCGAQFVIIEQRSNEPEPKPVGITGVSSTAPSEGVVGWRGEMIFQCGAPVKPIRLVRKPDEATPTESGTTAAPVANPPAERVCVPGVTQACLGPGACSGAQACLPDGAGYGPCDCGSAAAPLAPPSSGALNPEPVPSAGPSGPPTVSPVSSASSGAAPIDAASTRESSTGQTSPGAATPAAP